MEYGLSDKTIQAIRGVFEQHPQVQKVILYGSRARGDFRNGSDIDLALLGEDFDLSVQFRIANEQDDLLLPYMIDLILLEQVNDPDLRERVEEEGVVFWTHGEMYGQV